MTQKQSPTPTPLELKASAEVPAQASAQRAPDGDPAKAKGDASTPKSHVHRAVTEQGSSGGEVTSPGRPVSAKRSFPTARPHIPANDDMPSIGGLIYALQQRPSRSPFLIALIASGVWFVLGLVLSWAVFQQNANGYVSVSDLISNPAIAAVIAVIVIPIALFWFLAILAWRAQELRLMSSAMTEVAVRLAEPDRMAEQSVASLGQTVRRQVAAMNDAISRALGRAGELEALVHNEVAALERSYTENENRIRNIIHELSSEREALANNSDRVSEALRGIGAQVTREIAAASEKAAQSLGQATTVMSENFAARGQKLTASVTAVAVAVEETLAERGARLTEQLAKHGSQAAESLRQSGLEVTRAIQETSDRTAAAISAKGNSLVASVIGMSERVGREIPVLLEKLGAEQTRLSSIIETATQNLSALETALSEKTQSLGTTLTDKTRVLQTILTEQTRAIDNSLADRIQTLETILSRKAQSFDITFSERTKALDSSLTQRAQALEAAVTKHTTVIRQTLDTHAASMEKTVSKQAASFEHAVTTSSASIHRAVEELARRASSGQDALANQAKSLKEVSATLMGQLTGLTKRFEEQGVAILNASRTFEASNTKMDSQLEARQVALTRLLEGVGARAAELDRMMNNYTQMLEQSLSQAELRARKVTELLAKDSAEKSQAAIREIERLRENAQTHTAKAVSELKANFSSLSDQVSQQLTSLSSKFNDATRHVKDTTRRASTDLETAQAELTRHARVLPETARQSATAMRRALQDQLSALDALSDLSQRHVYSATVSSPDPQRDSRREREPERESRQPAPPHDAAFSAPKPGYDYGQPPKPDKPMPDKMWGREEQGQPAEPFQQQHQQQPYQAEPMERKGNWSLGDLLARASEDDTPAFDEPSYGMPPVASAVPSRTAQDGGDFNMAELAAAIDERSVMDVWRRLKMGETEILRSRHMYSRHGQVTVERVRRRYELDETFRAIVERYCGDFEKMLQELSRSDPRGSSVQARLASDNGRIYFVLAHISGRLG